jgi:transcriptional regulator with XRE-family HTH domain
LEDTNLRNVIGPTIKALRQRQQLTQEMLAARCGVLRWDISENTVAKIETGLRCVTDRELLILARALRVKLREIFPKQPELF